MVRMCARIPSGFQKRREFSTNSRLSVGSPGEIRTPVDGSKAQELVLKIDDIDTTVSDFHEYCRVQERLSKRVSKDYKNVTRRLLHISNGEVSTKAIRDLLKLYLNKAPRTYNNIIDALKAFIDKYLGARGNKANVRFSRTSVYFAVPFRCFLVPLLSLSSLDRT